MEENAEQKFPSAIPKRRITVVLVFENAHTAHRRKPAINAEKNAEILSDEKIKAEENPRDARTNFEKTAPKVAAAESPKIPLSASGF